VAESTAWLIFLLPVAAFMVNAAVVRPFLGSTSRVGAYITILAIGASLVLSVMALLAVAGAPEHTIVYPRHAWLQAGDLQFNVGIMMNGLTGIMMVVVTSVSLLVQVYSLGYMAGDTGFVRYYTYMALFTASMIGLVLAENVVMLFVFWELVGLCSYLLIGFWFQRPSAAAAAKKAFLVTRLGDFGFLLALLFMFTQTGVLGITDLYGQVGGALAGAALMWSVLGIFAGAAGKSAQFPLHVWLPDAMEGPTPVSALIHAATMVAAGVFLVARFFPLFEASPTAMEVVAIIGAITAVGAALMGVVNFDIKRVLAYSTISQLGYMMMALGVGAYGAAIFHLFNHAFFKALLFLGSGSVNHATGTFDMRKMGGLRTAMPITYLTFLVGTLSLAGIPPLSGFFSKDGVLDGAWVAGGTIGQFVFWAGVLGAFLTAFYMLRAVIMTFWGQYRGGEQAEHGAHGEHEAHLHESPVTMALPLIVLAIPAAISWLANIPGSGWLSDVLHTPGITVHDEGINLTVAAISTTAALAGLALAYGGYAAGWYSPAGVARRFGGLYTLISNKYYLDNLYEGGIVRNGFYRGAARTAHWVDENVVDRTADGVGKIARNIGQVVKQLQTGQAQTYAAGTAVGLLLIYGAFIIFGTGR